MMLYFDHSTNASTDPKVMQLRLEQGGAAVDAYWYLVEQMHRDEQPLCIGNAPVMRVHCHTLCTGESTLRAWIEAMLSIGLFYSDESGEFVFSVRAMENVEKFQERQEKARSAAESRWKKESAKQSKKPRQSSRNAPAKQTQCQQNKTNSSNATNSITTTSSVAAAAAEAAPPADDNSRAPHCPMCDGLLNMDVKAGGWSCECIGAVKPESVVWR